MDDRQFPAPPAPVASNPHAPSARAADRLGKQADGRFARGTLDALPLAVVMLDEHGILLAANRAWRELAATGGGLGNLTVGDNCLLRSAQAAAAGDATFAEISSGLGAVIAGTRDAFIRKDVRCASQKGRWFDLSVSRLEEAEQRHFLVTLDDVTGRHRALDVVTASAARHRHAERIARLGHWRLLPRDDEWQAGAIEYSDQAAAILGLPPGRTTNSFEDMKRLIHPDDLDAVLAVYDADAGSYVVDYRVIRPDGTVVTVQETGETVEDAEHGLSLEFGTIQDVTEQRRDADRLRRLNDDLEHLVAERTAALAERESQLSRAQALAGIGHYTWHKQRERRVDGGWHTGLSYSPAIAAIFGVSPAELVIPDEEYIDRFVHPDDRAVVLDAYKNDCNERLYNRVPIEYRIVRPDGSIRHVVEIVERMAAEGSDVIEALGMIQDITTRKVAEQAQRESEGRLKAFMDNAPFIMSIKDTDGRLLMINREGAASYGAPAEALRGYFTEELMPGAGGRAITAMSREVVATGAAVTREIELLGRTRYHWSLEIEFPIRSADGAMTAIGGFAVDITEQKQAELALHESEARLRAIFDHVPVTLSLSDPGGRYTMVNKRFLEAVNVREAAVVGHTALEVFGPEAAQFLNERKAQVMRSLKPLTYELRTPTFFGQRDFVFTHFPIIDDGALTAVGTISLDLTEQRAAEAALHQAQKMELVGQLTGGLAHDFNNLLGAIIGNLDLLALEIDGRPHAVELLDRAIFAAEGGASLIQRLLAFSRRQTLSPRLIDVNRQVQGMQPLLEHSLGGGSSVTMRTTAEHPFSRVDPAQLEAALLNLAINARDAMPAGGRLTIETANVTMVADAATDPLPRPYVMIVVSDTGAGMPRDVLARVFEPFFTTKPVGKGTGLGLSMVHGFVKQSGGHVQIDSQLGHGTTVGLFLPCAAEEEADAADDVQAAATAQRSVEGERILIVEHDSEILADCVAALQQLGYRSIIATDAVEALQALELHHDIALIISDILLPGGMNGPELVHAARRDRPALKALYMSGLSDAERRIEADLPTGDLFLAKPYRINELAQLVADILAEPNS